MLPKKESADFIISENAGTTCTTAPFLMARFRWFLIFDYADSIQTLKQSQ